MKTLLVVLLLFTLAGFSSAYYCWVCESDDFLDGATCADPFFKSDSSPGLTKRQCSGKCYKEVTTYEDGNRKYKRGCDTCSDQCRNEGTSRVCQSCCLGQLCNHAPPTYVNRVVTLVAPILAAVFYFM